ncbi:NAD(P)/FAD-dependent oxidoreductase [Woodsholea maritima]|uniref:NAD(P)/FAD-dependent oxidoreductase n=1 Tax=Woodsholea maritima TaxID=240237 RepID=UPI000361CDB5|nr:FAD-dependent oxidoreductase [Woodsholea maritima]
MTQTATSSSAPTFDIAVIGAGVIGLTHALELAWAGQKVVIIDQEAPGLGTSFGNAGHIGNEQLDPLASPSTFRNLLGYLLQKDAAVSFRWAHAMAALPWMIRFGLSCRKGQYHKGLKALSALQADSLPAWADLLTRCGAPDLLISQGNYMVVETEAALARGRAEQRHLSELGVACNWLEAHEMREHLPHARHAMAGGIRFHKSGHVANPYRVSQALETAFRAAGGHVHQARVEAITPLDSGVRIDHTGGHIWAGKALICAGAWSHHLARPLGLHLPLETERGYHLHWEKVNAPFDCPIGFFERRILMTPMGEDLRMTGGTELGGLSAPPTPKHMTALKYHAAAVIPQYEANSAKTWMGYRPSLPDFVPAMGRLKADPRVFISTGHQHLGLTLGAVSARAMRDLILERPPALDMNAYNPHRFHTL